MAFADTKDPWAAREKGIADYHKEISRKSRDKYEAPARAWNDLQRLQNQAVSGNLDAAGEKEFKETRRDWNRKYKNTPVGIEASGVDLGADPFGAQNLYHDMSSQLFHDQPETYDRMYPWSPNRWARGIGKMVENTMPARIAKGFLGGGDPIVPKNVLAMRERFPGITGNISPEIQNAYLSQVDEALKSNKGIFGAGLVEEVSEEELVEEYPGTGQSALELGEFDIEKYFPPSEPTSMEVAQWFLDTHAPNIDISVEFVLEKFKERPEYEEAIRASYKESQ